jgi:hypothetical protein
MRPHTCGQLAGRWLCRSVQGHGAGAHMAACRMDTRYDRQHRSSTKAIKLLFCMHGQARGA